MTYHFYNCLKLIQTVNNNYHHIVELEELHNLLETSYIQPNFWRDNAKVEYEILAKICFETKWNHYSDKHLEWDVETILAKLEGKISDELFNSKIKEVITIDGLRIIFEDGFALIRQSNTEPVFTLRFEAKTKEKCEHYKNTLVDLTCTLVEDLISQKV